MLPSEAKRINDLGEPAIFLRREAERLYPNFNLASHVIGYTDDKGHGAVALEKAFDDAAGAMMRRAACRCELALDVRVQQALEHELRNVYVDQRANGAAGIVMDVNTGEVRGDDLAARFQPQCAGQIRRCVALQPGDLCHLRTRIDLQGLHHRQRARFGHHQVDEPDL